MLDPVGSEELAQSILNYLRVGDIALDGETVVDLLEFSCLQTLNALRMQCEVFIAHNLSLDIFQDILGLAFHLNLPSLLCGCLAFAQEVEEEDVFQELSIQEQHLVALAREMRKHNLRLSLSPEGKPAVSLSHWADLSTVRVIELLREINQEVPMKYLDVDRGDADFNKLRPLAMILPDLEEFTHTCPSMRSLNQPLLRALFPKLHAYGNRAHLSLSPDEVETYLESFATPGKANAKGLLTLRSLNLSYNETPASRDLAALAAYFPELYHFKVCSDKIFKLDLLKAIDISTSGCRNLTSLSAPKATRIDASGCSKLRFLFAPNALEVQRPFCPALTLFIVSDHCKVIDTENRAAEAPKKWCRTCASLNHLKGGYTIYCTLC